MNDVEYIKYWTSRDNPDAFCHMAKICLDKRDYKKYEYYLYRSATKGNEYAYYNLACCYIEGSCGFKPNLGLASQFLVKAREKNNTARKDQKLDHAIKHALQYIADSLKKQKASSTPKTPIPTKTPRATPSQPPISNVSKTNNSTQSVFTNAYSYEVKSILLKFICGCVALFGIGFFTSFFVEIMKGILPVIIVDLFGFISGAIIWLFIVYNIYKYLNKKIKHTGQTNGIFLNHPILKQLKIEKIFSFLKNKTPIFANPHYIIPLLGWLIVVFLLRFAFLHLWHNDNGGRWIPIAIILFFLLPYGFGRFVLSQFSSNISKTEKLIIISLFFIFLIAFL